jgi:hypothetical protein
LCNTHTCTFKRIHTYIHIGIHSCTCIHVPSIHVPKKIAIWALLM